MTNKTKSQDLYDKLTSHGIPWIDVVFHSAHSRVIIDGEDEDTVIEWAIKRFKLDLKAFMDTYLYPYSQKHNLSLKQAISVLFDDYSYNKENPKQDLVTMRSILSNPRSDNFASALLSGKTSYNLEENDTVSLLNQAVKYETQVAGQAIADTIEAQIESRRFKERVEALDKETQALKEQVAELEAKNSSVNTTVIDKNASEFTYKGVEYVAKEGDFACKGCAFAGVNCGDVPTCLAREREDGRSVIFIKKGTL